MAPHPFDPELVPFTYAQYPLGSILPRGWIEREIGLSADGLGGHLIDFYRFVKDSSWLGGSHEYTALNESAPYWYNYIVPLAYSLDGEKAPELRTRIMRQADNFLDYTLQHQAKDGWLGPETNTKTRGIWARCLLLQGMVNHALADSSRYAAILDAMMQFVALVHGMLSDDLTGYLPGEDDVFDPQWFGVVRAHELSLSLQWLLEVSKSSTDRQKIWEVMEMLWEGAKRADRDWCDFFTKDAFPKSPPVRQGTERANKLQHGVNIAQGLRFPAQLHRMHPSEKLKQQTHDALSMVMEHHGCASGGFSSDEYIGGLSAQRGIEVCCNVELMFSLAYLYRLFGEHHFCENLEQVSFNAFPAGISEDWWSHQYVTQLNQPWARELELRSGEKSPYYDVCRYANVFGLEPEFPCCTVNHPAAFPKLVMNTFVAFADSTLGITDGVLHCVLVAGQLELGTRSITCETAYPFDPLILKYRIRSEDAFVFAVRVPEWNVAEARVTITGKTTKPDLDIDTHSRNRTVMIRIPKLAIVEFEIELTAEVSINKEPDNTVTIMRGPLLYAYPIPYEETTRMPRNYLDQSSDCVEVPAKVTNSWLDKVRDHDLLPVGAWNIAIDPSAPIKVCEQDFKFPSSLEVSSWSSNATSTFLEVTAQEVNWPVQNGTAADPSIVSRELQAKGKPFTVRLIPYAAAKLHIARFPVISVDYI